MGGGVQPNRGEWRWTSQTATSLGQEKVRERMCTIVWVTGMKYRYLTGPLEKRTRKMDCGRERK